ncbi:hypothetical protein Salat_2548700 [Sesamum alatum]|uniref:Uncharacterized protein n=1 Tax=Sesamum alatum TaxID=300844 RepID=A0AAE2CCN3_9LAMI|nr:hypothetical protein Salat_2548700 [Sesamum alatum]
MTLDTCTSGSISNSPFSVCGLFSPLSIVYVAAATVLGSDNNYPSDVRAMLYRCGCKLSKPGCSPFPCCSNLSAASCLHKLQQCFAYHAALLKLQHCYCRKTLLLQHTNSIVEGDAQGVFCLLTSFLRCQPSHLCLLFCRFSSSITIPSPQPHIVSLIPQTGAFTLV